MDTSEKINILIADDKADNLTVLEAVLNLPHYNLVKATSGFEAVSLASKTEFAAILLDVQMPGKDGFETAKEIRRSGVSRDSPILFVTAIYSEEIYVNRGYESGAVDYIFKPFNPHTLRAKVAILADLFWKTRRVVRQSQQLRDLEKREADRKLLDVQIQGLQKEHSLNQRYMDLVNSLDSCIVWSADPKTLRSTFVSPKVETLTGFNATQFLQPGFWIDQVHQDDRAFVSEVLTHTQGGSDSTFEHRFITKDNRTLWFHTGARLSQGPDGSEIRGLSIDITRLKETERFLRESEEAQHFLAEAGVYLSSTLDYRSTLKKIVELAVPKFASWCAIHLLNDNLEIVTVAVSVEGRSEDDLIRRIEGEYKIFPGASDGIAQVIRTGRSEFVSGASKKKFVEGPNASTLSKIVRDFKLHSYMTVPLKAGTSVLGAMTIGSSVKEYTTTDLKLIEDLARRASLAVANGLLYKKAEEAINTRDEFLSIASHELRTPLTPLKIHFQNTARLINEGRFDVLTPERLKKMVLRSDKQVDRLNNLIDDLLNVARINLNRLTLNLGPTDLTILIKDVVEALKEQMNLANCALTLELDETIGGTWDGPKLEQVLVNLLTNAIKYGQGRPIKIKAENDGEMARILVQDHGIGIGIQDQTKIFNLFERAQPAKDYGGLGLGLFIVKNIILHHSGKVRIESVPGEGATFIIELPKAAVASRPKEESGAV